MSSLNTAILSELQAIRAEMLTLKMSVSALEERMTVKTGKAAAAPSEPRAKKEKKAKDPSAPPRAPTAWRLFADRVRSVLREAGFEGKSLGTECVQFCSSLKEENAAFDSWTESDILARRAAWVKPDISIGESKHGKGWAKTGERRAAAKTASAAASVASDGGAAPASDSESAKKVRKNPWAGLSEEQKAERVRKMKEGKAAKKAAEPASDAEAPASDGEAPVSVASSDKKKRQWSPEAKARAAEKRAAKKSAAPAAAAASAAPVKKALPALPASPALSAASASSLVGFQRVMLSGQPLWVNLTTGHAYNRLSDGGKGEWAGIFHRTPKPHIDDSVAEPTFTDLDELD